MPALPARRPNPAAARTSFQRLSDWPPAPSRTDKTCRWCGRQIAAYHRCLCSISAQNNKKEAGLSPVGAWCPALFAPLPAAVAGEPCRLPAPAALPPGCHGLCPKCGCAQNAARKTRRRTCPKWMPVSHTYRTHTPANPRWGRNKPPGFPPGNGRSSHRSPWGCAQPAAWHSAG